MTIPRDLDVKFMNSAYDEAKQGDCLKAKVGCVHVLFTDDNDGHKYEVIHYGHNRSVNGLSCEGVGKCFEYNGSCIRTLHAEQDLVLNEVQHGYDPRNITCFKSVLYITRTPCLSCAKLLYALGIREVVYNRTSKEFNSGIISELLPEFVFRKIDDYPSEDEILK